MFFKKKEDKPVITFRHRKDLEDVFPEPRVASKFMPEWFRKLKRTIPDAPIEENGTVKRCVPVLDAVTNGYIIPTWMDMNVKVEKEFNEDGTPWFKIYVSFSSNFGEGDMVGNHSWEQVGNACPLDKFELGHVLLKFTNPWVIETSPGYSVLFKSPPHQYNSIHIMEGIVDTDTYQKQVNFPFIWTGNEEGEFFFPKGTPLVHVMPFKRIDMDCKIEPWDTDRMDYITNKHSTHFFDKYKKLWWHKRKVQ